MPSSTLRAAAILAKQLLNDSFFRFDPTGWGSDYTSTGGANNGGTVDGNEGLVPAGKYIDLWVYGKVIPQSGYVQFDFYVGANVGDTRGYYVVYNGGEAPFGVEAQQFSGSTWQVDIFSFSISSSDQALHAFVPASNTWYTVKGFIDATPGGTVGIKVWKRGDPEPSSFQATDVIADDATLLTNPADWFTPEVYLYGLTAEPAQFDNLIMASMGPPSSPAQFRSLTADAVIRVTGQHVLTATMDALILSRHFSADAWVIGGRSKHDRFYDHFGTEPDSVIALSGPVDKWPTGTDLHTVLVDIFARLALLETASHKVSAFSAAAWIRPHLTVDAIIRKVGVTTDPFGNTVHFHIDAVITNSRRNGSFSAAAAIITSDPTHFTADAFLIDLVC
jgi:predicted Zn-dependent protease with MMP-like domain